MDARYRVVLTGELLQGHDKEQSAQALAAMLKQPVEKIRLVFAGRPTPLNKPLDFRGAKEVEKRFTAIGVGCKIEALEPRAPAAFAGKEPAGATTAPTQTPSTVNARAATVTCPRCHKAQPPAPECSACGLLLKQPTQSALALENISPASAPASTQGAAASASGIKPPEASDEERLMLFIGPRAERYLEKFEHFTPQKWSFGWNWAAFLFGAFWTLYRKMWVWTGVMVGVGLLSYAIPWLSLLLHLAFTVSADYLYYRHAHKQLQRLAGKPDEVAAHAGGTHRTALVLCLLVLVGAGGWVGATQGGRFGGRIEQVNTTLRADPQIAGIIHSDAGRKTASAFTLTALATYQWHDGGGDLQHISNDVLLREGSLQEEMLKDGWGNAVKVVADTAGFIVISAGGDGSFGSEDDIPVLFAEESS